MLYFSYKYSALKRHIAFNVEINFKILIIASKWHDYTCNKKFNHRLWQYNDHILKDQAWYPRQYGGENGPMLYIFLKDMCGEVLINP